MAKPSWKMPRFMVKGLDANGEPVQLVLQAGSRNEASEKALAQEILVQEIRTASSGRYKVKPESKLNLIRLLAVTTRSGLPIVEGLKTMLKESESSGLQPLILDIVDDIERGLSVSDAMANREGVFDELTIALVKAGEASGKLSETLSQLYEYENSSYQFRKKLKSALSYPVVVLGFSLLVVAIFMGFIVPRFKETYSGFSATLPPLTQFLMAISDIVSDYSLVLLLILVGVPLLVWALWKNPKYKGRMEQFWMRIPVFGDIYRSGILIRFSRTLGTMLVNQVPFLDSLFLAGEATNSSWFAAHIKTVLEEVRQGVSFSESMENTGIIPEFMLQMARMGEKTGRLGELLGEAANFYQENMGHRVQTLESVLQPVVVIFLGGFIGFLALALFLPMFELPGVLK